jgi:hypothetical protein
MYLDKQEDTVSYDDWITTDPRDRDPFEERPGKARPTPFDVGTITVPLSSTTARAVATYAAKHRQDLTAAVDALLGIALNRLSQSSAGGHKRWKGVSPAARSEAARIAVTARWDRYRRMNRERLGVHMTDMGRTTPRTDSSDGEKRQ